MEGTSTRHPKCHCIHKPVNISAPDRLRFYDLGEQTELVLPLLCLVVSHYLTQKITHFHGNNKNIFADFKIHNFVHLHRLHHGQSGAKLAASQAHSPFVEYSDYFIKYRLLYTVIPALSSVRLRILRICYYKTKVIWCTIWSSKIKHVTPLKIKL